MYFSHSRLSIVACISFASTTLLLLSSSLAGESLTLAGQLIAEDSLQPLAGVVVTAMSATRPPAVLEAVTDPDGRFRFQATAGTPYLLCTSPSGIYAGSCNFGKRIAVTARPNSPTIQLIAPTGTRIRVRVSDPNNLLRSPSGRLNPVDPLVLHVFAQEGTTRTRVPLQLVVSATVSDAVEASVIIPKSTNWSVGLSSIRGQLLDASGTPYQSDTAIGQFLSQADGELLAAFTLHAK